MALPYKLVNINLSVNFSRPPGPDGAVFITHPEEGAGWDQPGQDASGLPASYQAHDYSPDPQSGSSVPVLFRQPGEVGRLGNCTCSILWLLPTGELLPGSFNPATDLAWGDVAADSHLAPRMLQIHPKKSKV